MNIQSQGSDIRHPDCATFGNLNIATGERRSGQRLRTVYRVARVIARGDQGLARVHNISDEGLMLSISLDLYLGDTVRVDLSDNCTVSGKVVWRAGGRCGIKLNQPIDGAAVLKQLYDERCAASSRPMRLTHRKALIVSSSLGTQVVALRDISQGGMAITHDGCFTPGLFVKVQLNADVERRGVVRWSENGVAGIALMGLLSVEELGSLRAI